MTGASDAGAPIVHVWSEDFTAWWKVDGRGMTLRFADAGTWPLAEARRLISLHAPDKRLRLFQAVEPLALPDDPAAAPSEGGAP